MTTVRDDELDPRRWRALVVCVSALFMTLLDVSIVNVALPSIGRSTGAGPAELQWVVSGYALTFGLVPIIAGRLGDDRGRRRMLLIGIAAFVVCSATVGFAPTPGILIGGRMVQGLAGGLINPQVSGLVQQLFPQRERGRAFGTIGTVIGVATASGPVVGGALIAVGGSEWGWRICFLVNVPVGVTSFLLCRAWLPPTVPSGTARSLDLPGAGLLAVGLLGLLFPAVEFDAHRNLRLALLAIPALAVLTGFVLWERGPGRRRGHPLIDLNLFRIRSYAGGLGLALLFFCSYTGTPLLLALFLQEGLGFRPLQSGLTATAFAIGAGIAAPIGGRLIGRLGAKLLLGGLGVFIAGVAATAAVAASSAGAQPGGRVAAFMAVPLFVAGLGGGAVITPNQVLTLRQVDTAGGSTAGGMLQTAQRIGSALGSAVLTAVFYASVAGRFTGSKSGHYAQAYATALAVSVGFGLLAAGLALREVRQGRVAEPVPTG